MVSGWGWGRTDLSGNGRIEAHYFCWALLAWTFLSRFQCLRARQGSWSWRVERRAKPVWFHTDVKVVLILEDNAGTEIFQ